MSSVEGEDGIGNGEMETTEIEETEVREGSEGEGARGHKREKEAGVSTTQKTKRQKGKEKKIEGKAKGKQEGEMAKEAPRRRDPSLEWLYNMFEESKQKDKKRKAKNDLEEEAGRASKVINISEGRVAAGGNGNKHNEQGASKESRSLNKVKEVLSDLQRYLRTRRLLQKEV